jgi:hypothetical protein
VVLSDEACEDLFKQNVKKIYIYTMGQISFKMLGHHAYNKSMIHEKSAMHQVIQKNFTSIEGKEKLLAPKLDNLLKHVGH